MFIYYKIVQLDGDVIKTLFHGINGSRVLPFNEWIKAEIKDNVIDGRGSSYTSGLHIIYGLDNAKEYLKRFKRQDRIIVPCYARGITPKLKSKKYVLLADSILIPKLDKLPNYVK